MGIGDTLAEARRQAGLTLAQVSQQTRIRESIIASIEQGDFSSCGGDFYARGHIRSIAEVVGTDPVPLVREYDEEHGPPGKMRAAQIFEPATPIKIRERRGPNWSLAMVLALAVLVGLVVYHLVSSSSPKPAAAGTHQHVGTTARKPPAKHPAHPRPTATAAAGRRQRGTSCCRTPDMRRRSWSSRQPTSARW